MHAARAQDRLKLVELMVRTFKDNPALDWMIRRGPHREKRLRHFAAYAIRYAWVRQGVWLSDNDKGMALAFRSDRGRFDLLTLILWFRLGITTLRWRRVPALLQLERYRRKQRTSRPHLYFWFMGVEAGGESAGTELKNGIFGMADEAKLPVYAETSVKRNKTVFERIGFNTYHRWKSKDGILEFWFLRRNPIEG